MNNLCTDIGFASLNHAGELLCGDHLDVVEQGDGSTVIVLADGLGSGVKASILSTLTAKIISTMMAADLPIEDCVVSVAEALPVCSVRKVAYSTFTILHLIGSRTAELIQYDNPHMILIRDGKVFDYPETEMNIGGKIIYRSAVELTENDIFVAMSDGCTHAGIGTSSSFGWSRETIASFMEALAPRGLTAKALSSALIDECARLYLGSPGDDATACVVRVRRRESYNLLFGPPSREEDTERMMSLFFSSEGGHIICGGTTSTLAARYLGRPLHASLHYECGDIPPIGELDGVELVTEGVITVNRVVRNAKDYIGENKLYGEWSGGRDGASLLSHLLFEEATDVRFFVGRAINPAHQNPELPINFNIKMNLVEELSKCLRQMGKKIEIMYF